MAVILLLPLPIQGQLILAEVVEVAAAEAKQEGQVLSLYLLLEQLH
jgi:hypothetical protein